MKRDWEYLACTIDDRRKVHGFLLTAWVFLADHWHAIFYPRHPPTISEIASLPRALIADRVELPLDPAARI